MGVKYFGHFLLERSMVTADNLKRAIALQDQRNIDLGKICTTLGFLSHAAAERLNQRQRFVDKRYGELAVAEGLMTEPQLEQALLVQKRAHLPLGRALVEIGALDGDGLERALAAFREDQSPFDVDRLAVPPGVPGPDAAEAFVDLTKKLLARVARVQAKPEVPVLSTAATMEGDVVASQRIGGDGAFTVYLGMPNAVAREVMTALLGFAPDNPSRMDDLEGVKDFLNVVSVNVTNKLDERGTKHQAQPPQSHDSAPTLREQIVLICPLVAADDAKVVLALAW